jgi:DNA ligase (NAD+)
MDIEGLGDNTVVALADAGLVTNVADLYSLNIDDLVALDSFSWTSAAKLIFELDKSRLQTLPRLLAALGIKHVGPVVAEQLAEAFRNLDFIFAASEEELHEINGVGDAVYASLQTWLSSPDNRSMVESLRQAGVMFDNVPELVGDTTLAGMNILVTGKLPLYSRDEVKDVIKSHGGKAASGVSSSTTFVVAGDKAADVKIEKARSLKIPVLDADQFEIVMRTGQMPQVET